MNVEARPPRSLFITQDYPPRIGGAQSYYWGVIQTLDPDDLVIIAPHHPDAAAFDAAHPYRVIRTARSIMLPDRGLLRLALRTIEAHGLELVQFGHCLPLGLLGPALRRRGHPYLVFILGAEVTLPAVLPVSGQAIRAVMRDASLLVAVSRYTAMQAQRLMGGRVPTAVLDPAIDTASFSPPGDADARAAAKEALGIDGELVVCLGRLVPRKGQDRLIDAVALLRRTRPRLHLALIGGGRLDDAPAPTVSASRAGRPGAPPGCDPARRRADVAAGGRRVRVAVPGSVGRLRGRGLRSGVRRSVPVRRGRAGRTIGRRPRGGASGRNGYRGRRTHRGRGGPGSGAVARTAGPTSGGAWARAVGGPRSNGTRPRSWDVGIAALLAQAVGDARGSE